MIVKKYRQQYNNLNVRISCLVAILVLEIVMLILSLKYRWPYYTMLKYNLDEVNVCIMFF